MSEAGSLLALQDLDLEILRAKKRLDELPEKRAILETRAKIREVTELKGKAELLESKLSSQLKAHQDEITTLTEKIDAEQAKVMGTSDHRAASSITREMDGLRRRRDKVEMESLKVMERIEGARGQSARIAEAIGTLEARDAALVERYKAAGTALQSEIAALDARRATHAAQLEPALLARYDTAREARGGVGVGRLNGDSCSACRMSLPAERLRDLNAGPDVSVCPECHRLLVVRSEDAE